MTAQPQGVEPLPKLLPCPFCGGAAIKGMFNVWCDACGAESASDVDDTHEQVINRWNTRANLPRATAGTNDAELWRYFTAIAVAKGYESIEDALTKATPRPAGETTVEACLAELREMFPDTLSEIRSRFTSTGETNCSVAVGNYWIDTTGKIFLGPSLADCMAQVRAATRTEGEGEK